MSRLGSAAPTVHDVAQLAGVSAGTVSKALNGRGQLRAETRERVQLAAEQLGFRVNRLAKGLIEGRTYTVGVLTSDSFGRFTMPLMNGIEDSLGAGSVSTLLCDSRGDPLRERHYLAELLGRRVDGIFVTGRRADPRPSLGSLPVPVVYAMSRSQDPLDLSIVYDDVQGARLATEHLLAVGRKLIAYVSGPPLVYCLEATDNTGHRLDDVVVDPSQPVRVESDPLRLDGIPTLVAQASVREHDTTSWWPYAEGSATAGAGAGTTLRAVPYYAWGNRESGAMRVWIPAG